MCAARAIEMIPEESIYSDSGVRAHCLRVAAFAQYASTALDLAPDRSQTLAEACRLHHLSPALFRAKALNRLISDITGKAASGEPVVQPRTAAILRLASGNAEKWDHRDENLLLASILDAANSFDECFEGLPYDDRPVREVVDECLDTVIPPEIAKIFRTLRCLNESSLQAAIENFRETPLPSRHERNVALRARNLTEGSTIAPETAFEAGLIHDHGAELVACFGEVELSNLLRWRHAGFPQVYCERLISGSDHADWGARLMTQSGADPALVEAVRAHHRPETTHSGLAALLYLAEEAEGGEEDLPSAARIQRAEKVLGHAR